MAKKEKVITPNASEDTEKLDHSCFSGSVKWYSHSGKFGSFLKKKKLNMSTIQTSNCISEHNPRKMKTLYCKNENTQNLYTSVYSGFIHNRQKLEIAQMFISSGIHI